MLKVVLSEEEKETLKRYRYQSSSEESEKALMILLSDEGYSAPVIAQRLHRHAHTVRTWIKRYQEEGIEGLKRHFSPGRPRTMREKVKETLPSLLADSPIAQGYQSEHWTVELMRTHYATKEKLEVSADTIERSLRELGFTYKRPTKRPSKEGPPKEEKVQRLQAMIEEIQLAMKHPDQCEIFSLDESHFSNTPYTSRGWQKKIKPSFRLHAKE